MCAHGGTAIIARSNIDAVEVDTNTNTEFVAAAFSCKNLKKTLIIGSLYRPTNNSEYTDDLCKAISNLYDGRFVRKISSVLLSLVGKSTICWHPISLVKSIYALFIPTG
jgi:hypothetical protein